MVLFGGRNGVNFFNTTWEWDGAKWTQASPRVSPSARARPAMCYDEARKVIVLFGGVLANGRMLNDTWTYDGSNWTRYTPLGAPSLRSGAAMSYDRDRKVVVLFGGFVPSGNDSNEIYEWNGLIWRKLGPAKSPRKRGAHRMCYDRANKRTLLYGGYSSFFKNTLSDTWTWDGTKWKEFFLSVHPEALCDQAMEYDVARNRVLFYGGLKIVGTTFTRFGNTWDWNGSKWLRRAPKTKPGKRDYGHTGYDIKRRRFMMFGGTTGSNILNDTWYLQATQPASLTEYGKGCTGGGGVPQLAGDVNKLPWMGAQFDVNITKAASAAPVAIWILGGSKTKWGPFKLPLDLKPFGAAGCFLNASYELTFPVSLKNGSGTLAAVMCNCPTIIGIPFQMQAMILDSSVSRFLKIAVTNGLTGIAGNR